MSIEVCCPLDFFVVTHTILRIHTLARRFDPSYPSLDRGLDCQCMIGVGKMLNIDAHSTLHLVGQWNGEGKRHGLGVVSVEGDAPLHSNVAPQSPNCRRREGHAPFARKLHGPHPGTG